MKSISGYTIVEKWSGSCAWITSYAECEAAAQHLGLSDMIAGPSPVTEEDVWGDPPFCYVEDGSLKFNSDGSNFGNCGWHGRDLKCLQKHG